MQMGFQISFVLDYIQEGRLEEKDCHQQQSCHHWDLEPPAFHEEHRKAFIAQHFISLKNQELQLHEKNLSGCVATTTLVFHLNEPF